MLAHLGHAPPLLHWPAADGLGEGLMFKVPWAEESTVSVHAIDTVLVYHWAQSRMGLPVTVQYSRLTTCLE